MQVKNVQQLSFSPSIWLVKDFLTPEQCNHLIRVAQFKLERSATVDPETGEDIIIDQRSSEQAFLETAQDEVIAGIEQQIADLVEIPVGHGEPLQVLRYQYDQEYQPHYDYFDPNEFGSHTHLSRGGQRKATVILYLTDVEEGGETVFPEIGLEVKPKRGSALVFFNLFENGELDPASLHGSLPVKKGVKWAATKWLRENEFILEPVESTSPAPEGTLDSLCPAPTCAERTGTDKIIETHPPSLDRAPFYIRVWRVHPNGARFSKADKTLTGEAPFGAVGGKGPYTRANAYGYWLYSPVDVDILWHGQRSFEYELLSPYTDEDLELIKNLQKPEELPQYQSRVKLNTEGVHEGVFSIWTGCAFQTPPGWCLMLRGPVNKAGSPVFTLQETILETDCHGQDVWMNLRFLQQNRKVSLRRDSNVPIAQIIPVKREGFEGDWPLIDGPMERQTSEGERFYRQWMKDNPEKDGAF